MYPRCRPACGFVGGLLARCMVLTRYWVQNLVSRPTGGLPGAQSQPGCSTIRLMGMELTEDDLRAVTAYAADCAARVLELFEERVPGDDRPREAIEAARRFVAGARRTKELRTVAWAALAAAKESTDPVAVAAAQAAGYAAGAAYLHPLATAGQANHLLGPGVRLAQAREIAAGNDVAVGDREICWAIEQAPVTVRVLLRQMPAREPARSRVGTLFYQLDVGLRSRT